MPHRMAIGDGQDAAYGVILQVVEVTTVILMGMLVLLREGMSWREVRRGRRTRRRSGPSGWAGRPLARAGDPSEADLGVLSGAATIINLASMRGIRPLRPGSQPGLDDPARCRLRHAARSPWRRLLRVGAELLLHHFEARTPRRRDVAAPGDRRPAGDR